jgi:hypothetical protein
MLINVGGITKRYIIRPLLIEEKRIKPGAYAGLVLNMTVCVSNDDDEKEDKRFAFLPSFIVMRCTITAVHKVCDLSFLRFAHAVPVTPGPRGRSARVKRELTGR